MFLLDRFFKDKPKGLTLPEYKTLSNHDGDIKTLPLYDKYYVALLQRDGNKAIPTVNIGDCVNAGDIIARPTSNLALHRHAPTSGEVTAIVDITETHPSGMTVKALEITADGHDSPTTEFPPIENHQSAQRETLIERIFEAGIAGMGGAGFPTEKKINLSEAVNTLIINGAECEPYITCDDLLMRHYAEEILRGAFIFARILRAKNILVGIEDNKPEAIAVMQTAAEQLQSESNFHLAVHVLPTQYPMGSRHQIAHYLLGKRPNTKARSYQSGFVCHNVATAKATYDAIALGKPLTERLVTFSGDGVGKAGVYLTKCGANFADITTDISLSTQLDEIIIGGTMMGFAISPNHEKPIVIKRETTSILAFSNRPHHTIAHDSAEENCIRCGQCADVCPMDLLPQQLNFYGRGTEYAKLEENRLFDCIECGLCNYVCPSNIPLVQVFQHSKGELLVDKHAKQESEQARIRFESRNDRMEAEKAEKKRRSEERRAKMKKMEIPNKEDTEKPTETVNDKKDLIAAALARKKAPLQAQPVQSAQSDKTDKQDLIAQALARKQEKLNAQQQNVEKQLTENDTQQTTKDAVAEAIAKRKAEKQANGNSAKDKEALIAEAMAKREAKKKAQQESAPLETTDKQPTNNVKQQITKDAVAKAIAKRKAKKQANANSAKDKEALIAEAMAKREAEKQANGNSAKDKEALIAEAMAKREAKKKAEQEKESNHD